MKFPISRLIYFTASCLLLLISACASEDSNSSTSTSSNTTCMRLTTDSSDNVFVSGYTSTSLNSETIIGESDIFLIKYAADGTQAWSHLIGTTDNDYMQGLATTTAGETLIAGYTYGAFTGNTNKGGADILLVKTAADGTNIWKKQFGTSSDDFGYGMALDATGDIYIAGHTYGSYPGSGTTRSGTKDFVLIKLDSSGNQLWSSQISNNEDDNYTAVNGVYGVDVKTDAAGNIYAAGFTTGNLPGNTSSGSYDMFITKYDASGNRLWITQLGSDGSDFTRGLQVTTAGDVYITGYTSSTLSGQTLQGGYDLFLVKLNTGGAVQWIKQSGTSSNDISNGIVLDSSGNILIAGYTNGGLSGDNLGGSDLLIIKFSATGTITWTTQMGTSSTELSRAISLDSTDRIYLTGYTYGALHGVANSDNNYYSFLSQYSSASSQVWTKLF